MSDPNNPLSWKDFKTMIRETFYPPHIRKQKSNKFARLKMGEMFMDEYYKKFIEYVKYCSDDIPTEEKKMQRFELVLVKRCMFILIAIGTSLWMRCIKELPKSEV